ncbi:MAG: DegV family protein [Gammaproteobacteria bacterium]
MTLKAPAGAPDTARATVGVVIDATCDLPRAFIDDHRLEVLPVSLELGERSFVDKRDPEATREFYERYIASRSADADTHAISVEATKDLFLERLVLRYDRVLVLCMSSTRGRIFEHASRAARGILAEYRQRRAEAGLSGPFVLRVLDTQTLCAGEAVLAHEAVKQLESATFDQARRSVAEIIPAVRAYLVPRDLFYLRKRAGRKGDHSVSLLEYQLGRAMDRCPVLEMHKGETRVRYRERGYRSALARLFEHARESLRTGLHRPVVAMSYAGNPQEIRELPACRDFLDYAAEREIGILFSVMSAAAGVNVGPGAFSMAYIEGQYATS